MRRFRFVSTAVVFGALVGTSAAQTLVFADCPDCPLMVEIAGGSFRMGLADWWSNDRVRPVHDVTVRPFAIGLREITKEQFDAFIDASGRTHSHCGYRRGDNGAARCLTWFDAQAYVEWLTRRTGQFYRLPSEAEWEYVAQDPTIAGVSRFGVLDLFVGVSEWMADCYYANYRGAPTDGSPWAGDPGCRRRVVRGGSWHKLFDGYADRWTDRRKLRALRREAAARGGRSADRTTSTRGMRVVRELPR